MLWMQLYEWCHKYVCDVVIRCKIPEKKLLQTTIHLRKSIQLKLYSHLVTNVWISSFILILIFWWLQLAAWEATESLSKFYLEFWIYLENKICILPGLNCFLPHWQPVSSWVLVETLNNDECDMLYAPNFMRSWVIVQIE